MAKPQLHYSSISMYWKCGEQYYRRYVKNEKIPPGVSMIKGIGVHKIAEMDLKNKCETGVLLPLESITDQVRDKVLQEYEKGCLLTEEESKENESDIKGKMVDDVVNMSSAYHYGHAVSIDPISINHIEKKWVVSVNGFDFDIAGTLDVEEGETIRDIKTAAKTPARNIADRSLQLTMYALSSYIETHEIKNKFCLDYVVNLKSGVKTPTLETKRSKKDFKFLLDRLSRTVDCIKKGSFPPAAQESWWCDKRYCGYADTCKFYF